MSLSSEVRGVWAEKRPLSQPSSLFFGISFTLIHSIHSLIYSTVDSCMFSSLLLIPVSCLFGLFISALESNLEYASSYSREMKTVIKRFLFLWSLQQTVKRQWQTRREKEQISCHPYLHHHLGFINSLSETGPVSWEANGNRHQGKKKCLSRDRFSVCSSSSSSLVLLLLLSSEGRTVSGLPFKERRNLRREGT